MPGMIYGATVRSAIPRGRVLGIEFGAGIPWDEFTIVTAKDIPGKNYIALINNDWPCLADGFVNHPQEPILLLAHPDRHLLPKAVAAVRIEYEELPSVHSIEESESGRTIVWGEDNVLKSYLLEKGDVDAAFAQPDIVVVEARIHDRGAGAPLYREQRCDCGLRRARRSDAVGLAAVSVLCTQVARGGDRAARGQGPRDPGGDRRGVRGQGRLSVDDRRTCGAAGDEVGASGEDCVRPHGGHGGDDQAPSFARAASHSGDEGWQAAGGGHRNVPRRRRVLDSVVYGVVAGDDSFRRSRIFGRIFA